MRAAVAKGGPGVWFHGPRYLSLTWPSLRFLCRLTIFLLSEIMHNTEIWISVVGYEGMYEVSSHGRVKSLPRMARLNYRPRKLKERILRPGLSGNGYETVVLYKPGHRQSHCIHRLVAEAFIPNPMRYAEVNHKDGEKLNCNVTNLEWCTSSYNTKHAYQTGLIDPKLRRNSRHPQGELHAI
jgi:hypothetical protein